VNRVNLHKKANRGLYYDEMLSGKCLLPGEGERGGGKFCFRNKRYTAKTLANDIIQVNRNFSIYLSKDTWQKDCRKYSFEQEEVTD
jgi:hypothetical protein